MRLSQKCSNHPILGLTAGIPLLSKGGEMVGYQYYNFLLLFRGGVPLTERSDRQGGGGALLRQPPVDI